MTARTAINPKPDPAVAALEAVVRRMEARLAALEAAERARAGGKARQRRYLDRKAKGQRRFEVWADEVALSEMLVAARFLDPLVADEPAKIQDALQAWSDSGTVVP